MTAAEAVRVLLKELEDRWRRAGATPVLEALRPGLSDSAIRGVETTAHIRLPSEMRLWFNWRDGVAADDIHPGGHLGPSFSPYTLVDAVAIRAQQLALEADWVRKGGVEPGSVWSPTWLPLCVRDGSRSKIVVDLAAHDTDAALLHVDKEGPDRSHKLSLASLVTFWIGCFDAGLYRWQQGGWVRDKKAAIPPAYANFYE